VKKSMLLPPGPALSRQVSIGIDLGAEESVACSLDRAGAVIGRLKFEMTPEAVTATFGGQPRCTILMETCGFSAWVARLLEQLGHEVLVADPRKLRQISQSPKKTDKNDAEKLARCARMAQFDPKYVPVTVVRSAETQLRRSYLAVRETLVSSRTKDISLVRSVLRSHAIPRPKAGSDRFHIVVERLQINEELRELITPLIGRIADATERISQVDKKIVAMAKEMPFVQKAIAIPGLGILSAFAYVTSIEDPTRFEDKRQSGAFLGLTPWVKQSSTSERRGGISKQGDERVRRLLVQAALCLLRSKHDTALRQWGLAVAERRGRKRAAIAVARKLSVVLLAIWLSGESYVPFPESKASHAA